MNTMLPSNPPSIVIYSVAANCCLNICITANIDIPSVREITLEITGDNPEIKKKKTNSWSVYFCNITQHKNYTHVYTCNVGFSNLCILLKDTSKFIILFNF